MTWRWNREGEADHTARSGSGDLDDSELPLRNIVLPASAPRTSRILALYFFAVLIGGSLLAPQIFHALSLGNAAAFPNLAIRVFAITALLGLIVVLRQFRFSGAETWGYALPLPQGIRSIAIGFAFGLLSMGMVVALEIALGLQVRDEARYPVSMLIAAIDGCLVGFGVALVEETFFRGGLQSAFSRADVAGAGVWMTAVVYALAHLLDDDIVIGEVNWLSGFRILAAAIMALAEPGIYGALLTLFLVGVVLALIRQFLGHINLCIGLHAGWVAVIQWARKAYGLNDAHPLAWLVSDAYDGIIGYLAAAMLMGLLAASWLWFARHPGKGG